MISLSYDVHIHSCLSPCANNDMTPFNIIGMAALKQLDVIAVTDHNSCKNCRTVLNAASEYGITVLPGMEICTSEEVHVLCLFAALEDALAFDAYIYQQLPYFKNNEKIFGNQFIYNEQDKLIGVEEKLLINSTTISFDSLDALTKNYHGITIPAHIDKPSNSILSNLGFVPPDSTFTCAEFKDMKHFHAIKKLNPYLDKCKIIHNSDAHTLGDISEPNHTLMAKENTATDILHSLSNQT